MAKKLYKSTLYHLIEAGQLARFALQRPLPAMGICAGDDAIILALKAKKSLSDDQLCAKTGLTPYTLELRVNRLLSLSYIKRDFSSSNGRPTTRLSKSGRKLQKRLISQWHEMQDALMEDLQEDEKKILKKILKRFSNILSL